MITVAKAKKIVGKDLEGKTDNEIQNELDTAIFMSEIILDVFKQKELYGKVKKNINHD